MQVVTKFFHLPLAGRSANEVSRVGGVDSVPPPGSPYGAPASPQGGG